MPVTVTISLPLEEPSYRLGLRLLAVLAHPPLSDQDQRWRLAERALGHVLYMALFANEPGWIQRPQLVVPEFLTLPSAAAQKENERLRTHLDQRMGAAHVAVPYFQKAAGKGPSAATRPKSQRIDSRIMRTLEQEQTRREQLTIEGATPAVRFPEQVDNFDARVLRPSLPVLHIAVAAALAIDRSQKVMAQLPSSVTSNLQNDAGGAQISLADILLNPALARSIVEDAAVFEGLLREMAVLKPKTIVHLVME